MALSYLSSFEGGKNDLHFGVDMAVTAVFSLVIYYFALSRRLPDELVRERMEERRRRARARRPAAAA